MKDDEGEKRRGSNAKTGKQDKMLVQWRVEMLHVKLEFAMIRVCQQLPNAPSQPSSDHC